MVYCLPLSKDFIFLLIFFGFFVILSFSFIVQRISISCYS